MLKTQSHDTGLEIWCHRLLSDLHHAKSPTEFNSATLACLDFGRFITNTILPLAVSGNPLKVERMKELAEQLIDTGRPWIKNRYTDENFPKTDRFQLLLDKFESVEFTLTRLLNAQHVNAQRRVTRRAEKVKVAA